ncbi:unnamed protein product [Heligmosomoides polygyrus]|uniref:Inorganic diphosphatase n=1 Tax=Heligmosomoides polygyrus TaxID=6339 RepID=A0A183GGQ2_HELPZ|nr:unnamed protein product [Heligmosomoides polygyrus]
MPEMTICTYNARTLASAAFGDGLMIRTNKAKRCLSSPCPPDHPWKFGRQLQKPPVLGFISESPGGQFHNEIDHIIFNRKYCLREDTIMDNIEKNATGSCATAAIVLRESIAGRPPGDVCEETTAPGPDRIRPEHLKNLPPTLVNTLARFFTRYLSECRVPPHDQFKTSRTVLLYKERDVHDISNYRPICLLSVVYKLFT